MGLLVPGHPAAPAGPCAHLLLHLLHLLHGLLCRLLERIQRLALWIDSLANGEELSMSGRRAAKHADLWLTQWPELAEDGGPEYAGSVL